MGPYLGVRDVPHCHGVVVEDAVVAEVAGVDDWGPACFPKS